MPYYRGHVLALGVRLVDDVKLMESGHLFVPPLDAMQTIKFVLDRAREPLTLETLEQEQRHALEPTQRSRRILQPSQAHAPRLMRR